jgi:hypothetical protein
MEQDKSFLPFLMANCKSLDGIRLNIPKNIIEGMKREFREATEVTEIALYDYCVKDKEKIRKLIVLNETQGKISINNLDTMESGIIAFDII